jgi:hypothetical protein
LSTSQAMTASANSGRVLMRGAPTGLIFNPTISCFSKNISKLSFMFFPVRRVKPCSNIRATTRPSKRSPTMDLSSRTMATLPGNGPGNEKRLLGTRRKSAMLVSTLGNAVSCPARGTPKTSRPAVQHPIALTKLRRFMGPEKSLCICCIYHNTSLPPTAFRVNRSRRDDLAQGAGKICPGREGMQLCFRIKLLILQN